MIGGIRQRFGRAESPQEQRLSAATLVDNVKWQKHPDWQVGQI